MITYLFILLEHYLRLAEDYPGWITVLSVLIHLCALTALYSMNHGETTKRPVKFSHNTLHTYLWAVIILALPFVGVLLFVLFSVVPFRIWKKKNSNSNAFPFAFLLRRFQILSIITAGIIGTILGKVLNDFEWDFGREAAFLSWALVVLVDWFYSFFNKAVFYKIKPSGKDKQTIQLPNDLLCMTHRIEAGADTIPDFFFSDETATVRMAANNSYAELSLIPSVDRGTININGKALDYNRVMTQSEFNKKHYDTVDAVYLGLGITRYVVSVIKNNRSETSIEDSILYRAVPRLRFFFLRAAILYVFYLVLFTKFFASAAMKITYIIDSITF